MSRRCHHGSPRHARGGRERRRPTTLEAELDRRTPGAERPLAPAGTEPPPPAESLPTADGVADVASGVAEGPAERVVPPPPSTRAADAARVHDSRRSADEVAGTGDAVARTPAAVARAAALVTGDPAPGGTAPAREPRGPRPGGSRAPGRAAPGPPPPSPGSNGSESSAERGTTAPQLRRFIKSRAYVPMHELRRRFAINGQDDDVTVVDLDAGKVFVGLPEREGQLLGELLRGGDIGYELSLDPISPIVVGVYPMRPVART